MNSRKMHFYHSMASEKHYNLIIHYTIIFRRQNFSKINSLWLGVFFMVKSFFDFRRGLYMGYNLVRLNMFYIYRKLGIISQLGYILPQFQDILDCLIHTQKFTWIFFCRSKYIIKSELERLHSEVSKYQFVHKMKVMQQKWTFSERFGPKRPKIGWSLKTKYIWTKILFNGFRL